MKAALMYATVDLLLKSEVAVKQSTKIFNPQLNTLYQDLAISSTPKLNISRLG